MADLSHLSDDDLKKIASSPGPADLSHMSDDDLKRIAAGESGGSQDNPIETSLFSDADRAKASFGDIKGVGKMLLDKGKYIDFAKNKNGDLVAKDLSGQWHKDANGFLSHPINWAESGAGKSLPLLGGLGAGIAGIESGPGAIAAAAAGGAGGEALRSSIGRGMGVYDGDVGDQALDAAKEAAIMGTGEGAGRYVLGPAARSLANSGIKDVAQAGADKLGSAAAKAGELFTGVPKQEIKTYAKHGPEIDQLYKSNDGNIQDMADELKNNIGQKVTDYRKAQNDKISEALKTAPEDKNIDVSPVISRLQEARAKLAKNPNMNKEALKDLDDLLSRVEDPMARKNNSVKGYITGDDPVTGLPNEKNVTISHEFAPGGPQKRFNLHDPGEPFIQQGTEVMSDRPGQQGQRAVPVLDTTPSVLGEAGMPSEGAQKILGNKTISRIGVNNASQDMLSNPDWGGVKSIVDSGHSPLDSTIDFPVGKQVLQGGEESAGKPTFSSNLNGLHEINQFLQDQARPAYGSTPLGFKVGDAGANAAKGAAGVGGELMENAAKGMPGAEAIEGANAKLSRLHDVEDTMNRNLLSEGKTASPLLSAGSGTNEQTGNSLRDLGNEIGYNALGDAQKLAAARTFGSPGLMPTDTTGKAVGRMGLAAGLGFLSGGPGGAVAAGAMTSPAALKLAINTGRGMANIASSPLVKAVASNPELLKSIANPELRSAVSQVVDKINNGSIDKEDETHYDPFGQKVQQPEVAKQKFLEGN